MGDVAVHLVVDHVFVVEAFAGSLVALGVFTVLRIAVLLDRRGRRAGGRIGERAGYALSELFAAAVDRPGLAAAYRRRVAALVGAVALAGFLAAGEINLRGDLGAHVLRAQDRRQNVFNTLAVDALHFAHVLQLGAVQATAAAGGTGQQASGLIDHGDVLQRQFRHAAGDHMHDRVDLAVAQRAARFQGQYHGRLGGLAVADEDRRLGHGQMHPGPRYRAQGFNGTGQLALQTALEIHLLGELADAERLIVHDLEAHVAAFRQALFGELQTQFVDLIAGHHQGATALAELVGHRAAFQFTDDAAAVGFAEVAVEHAVFRRAGPHQHGRHQGDHRGPGHQQRHQRVGTQPRQHLLDAVVVRAGLAVAHACPPGKREEC